MDTEVEAELTDTRKILQDKIESLEKKLDDLSALAFELKRELSERDEEIDELRKILDGKYFTASQFTQDAIQEKEIQGAPELERKEQ